MEITETCIPHARHSDGPAHRGTAIRTRILSTDKNAEYERNEYMHRAA